MTEPQMEASEDLAGGEVAPRTRQVTSKVLEKEVARQWWATFLSWLTVAIVVVFYACLLLFIFCGHIWGMAGWPGPLACSAPHTLVEMPIILVLSTIPTLLLIALLRHYHSDTKKSDGNPRMEASPLAVQLFKEAIRMNGHNN